MQAPLPRGPGRGLPILDILSGTEAKCRPGRRIVGIVAGIFLRTLGAPIGCVLGLILGVVTAAAAFAEGRIVVASKIDTEGALLGNMILTLLDANGLAVENKLQLGPTNIVRAAIMAGQVDIYPEYTGNGALFFHLEQDRAWKNWQRGYARVEALCREKHHLVGLTPAPANKTWVIAVRR